MFSKLEKSICKFFGSRRFALDVELAEWSRWDNWGCNCIGITGIAKHWDSGMGDMG